MLCVEPKHVPVQISFLFTVVRSSCQILFSYSFLKIGFLQISTHRPLPNTFSIAHDKGDSQHNQRFFFLFLSVRSYLNEFYH